MQDAYADITPLANKGEKSIPATPCTRRPCPPAAASPPPSAAPTPLATRRARPTLPTLRPQPLLA